jgi:hypothetical protein
MCLCIKDVWKILDLEGDEMLHRYSESDSAMSIS